MEMAITLPTEITDVLEQNGFHLLDIEAVYDGPYATLEFNSPLGEDFIFSVWFDGTPTDFVDMFEEYVDGFNPDEHAAELIRNMGKYGVPTSVRDLIDDAEAIYDRLDYVSAELSCIKFGEYISGHWQEVLESPMPYERISSEIEWGFTDEDLQELMRLHKENVCREKIEDLLEDCNFHTECGNWHDGNYIIRED